LGHEVTTLLSKDDRLLVGGEGLYSIDLGHDLVVGSLLGETLLQFLLGLTFELDSLGDLGGNLLFGVGDCCYVVSVSVGYDLGGFGLSFLDNLGFDELCLSNNLIVLKISLCVNLLNLSGRLGLPLLLNLLRVSLNPLNLLSLVQLIKLSLLINILPLLLLDLLFLLLFFLIILDSLFVSEGLSFQGVLELIDSSFLHRGGHILTEDNIGDDDPLHEDSFVIER